MCWNPNGTTARISTVSYTHLDVYKRQLHFDTPFTLTILFVCVVVFAVVRGFLRYAEQACNHFIAFKLLALLRDKVFRALRRLDVYKRQVQISPMKAGRCALSLPPPR